MKHLTPTSLLGRLRQLWHLVRTDIMLQNSLFIMASTGTMAVFGFLFWLIGARLYTTEQIGLSSTLVTAVTTLSMFAMLGFDNVLVRFLPTARDRNAVINTSFITGILAALTVALLFLVVLPFLSPQLAAVIESPLHAALFVAAMMLFTLNVLTDSVFIGLQQAKYILIADIGLSLVKIGLPLALIAMGAFGLFIGFVGSVIVSTAISLFVIIHRFSYRFRPSLDRATLRRIAAFSGSTYLAGLIGSIPALALPIITTNMLGAPMAAYFNLAITVAALLYIVPRATASSFFAHGSKDEGSLVPHYLAALRQSALILIPAVIAVCLLGQYMLLVFGQEYADTGIGLLRILALSALLLGFNAITTVVLKVTHRLWQLIAVEAIGTVSMIALTWPFIIAFGLDGVGWAWISGQALMSACLAMTALPVIKSQQRIKAADAELLHETMTEGRGVTP